MGTGAEIAAYAAMAASAAGAGATYMSAQEQADARQRATNQGIESQADISHKSADMTKNYVGDTFDPTTRAANYEGVATTKEKSFGDLLAKQATDGQGGITDATTGAVSDAYTRSKATATADASQRARTLSRLLSRGGANAGLFSREALTGADYSSDMLGLGTDSQLAKNRTQVGYDAAGREGSGLALLGGLLSGSSGAVASIGKKKGG